MNRKRVTSLLLLTFVAALVVWDIYVAVVERTVPAGSGATISELVLGFAGKHPVLPFAVGVVCGHLLWPQVRARPV